MIKLKTLNPILPFFVQTRLKTKNASYAESFTLKTASDGSNPAIVFPSNAAYLFL
jgi:hypothetical protein